jgi:hypothetical protein
MLALAFCLHVVHFFFGTVLSGPTADCSGDMNAIFDAAGCTFHERAVFL